jgi:glycosyltransferase involved in cell wall biosynthesis
MKKKLLFITDDILATTGVAKMSKSIVFNLSHKFDFLIIGAFERTPNHGKLFDLSQIVNEATNQTNTNVKTIHYSGYGDETLYRQILKKENIDGVLIMSDPRHHLNFFNAIELFNDIPKLYYYIWDSHLTPYFNLPYLDSMDSILSISTITERGVEEIFDSKNINNKVLKYIPHGIDEKKFYSLNYLFDEDISFNNFKQKLLQNETYDLIVGFNSVNIPRKNIPELISAFKLLSDDAPHKKFLLLLKTQRINVGGDLDIIIEGLCGKNHNYNIKIVDEVFNEGSLNMFYNTIDVLCLPSCAEGFGLSICEAMFCEKMIVSNYTGGMIDQSNFGKGVWCEPIFDFNSILTSHPIVPYIYQDYPNVNSLFKALKKVSNVDVQQRKVNGKIGREWALNNGFNEKSMTDSIEQAIDETFDKFVLTKKYSLTTI